MKLLDKILETRAYPKPKNVNGYTIELFTDSDFKQLMNLYEKVFPGYMSIELWKWKNNLNPSGKYITLLMKIKNEIIAAYSVSPKEFSINGNKKPHRWKS